MPLNEGAKPGSKGFSENVATEVNAHKPVKQAVAIAYRESGEKNDVGARMDALMARADSIQPIARNDANDPSDVTYRGKRYSRTGKVGKNIKTGEHSAEYRYYGPDGDKDERLWRTQSGKIEPD